MTVINRRVHLAKSVEVAGDDTDGRAVDLLARAVPEVKRRAFLTAAELAAVFSVDARSIYRWGATGEGGFPKPVRLPGRRLLRWRVDDLLAFLGDEQKEV